MKTINRNTAITLLTLLFFGFSLSGYSQERKMTRQERNEARQSVMTANFNILDSLLTQKKFVLEADYLSDQYGNITQVPSNTNFIRVNSTDGVLQTGWYSGIGYNGLGGVTTEGSIQSWKLFRDSKKLSYNLQFSLNTTLGIYDVSMNVNADNNVYATISGLWPGKLIYKGHLATLENSNVFKGTTTL
ncbi:MAG: DUF4251 domain-containing protein [Bacteroidota bacterium]|nr:DUF4251 domain-containing protein [Bacteroidota bacterium]